MRVMNRDQAPKPLAATYSEYRRVYNNISVVRRPQGQLEYMQALGFSEYVLKTLNTGYVLPFVELPKGAFYRNNASARRHPEFVRSSIDELLLTGAIKECSEPCHVVNPLSVAGRPEKLRLVLDCREINKLLKKQKVTVEGPEVLVNFIKKGGYLISFDIKSGYHHIPIIERHQKFLGFAYSDSTGTERLFIYLFIYCHLYSAFSIVQCSNALYRL